MDRRSAFRSLVWTVLLGFLVVGLSASGCDLLGADSNDAPKWVGNWKVTSLDGEAPDRPRFWSITEEEWDVVEETSGGECSVLSRGSIIERDGNVVTVEFSSEATFRLRLTVVGDSLASQLVEGPEGSNDLVAAEAISFNPLEQLDC